MKFDKRIHLAIVIAIITSLMCLIAYIITQLPFVMVIGRDNSSLIDSYKIDQDYYRENWSNDRLNHKFPVFVFLTFVDQKQEFPLKLIIGDTNFDGFVSYSQNSSLFGLLSFVRLNINKEYYNKNTEYDLSYLISLAFEQSATLSVVDRKGMRDYFISKELYEKIGLNISNYYKLNSSLPITVDLSKPQ